MSEKLTVIREGSVKKNLNPPPTTERPAPPRSQISVADKLDMREIDEESLRRMAHIIGPSGASSLALADFERRREAGENPTRPSETLIRLYLAFHPGESHEIAEEFLSQGTMDGSRWFSMEKEMERIFQERIEREDRK